ncbi:MAG TPA: HEAT repeat domain-containing protein, partial [Anaerolineaceae bacterium]|nr:HEAT repeat domain-containing protein [Anaerolineaceae bacterium]
AAGFLPLALAAWQPDEAHTFVRRWKEAWDQTVSPHVSPSNGQKAFDTHLLENWLANRTDHRTPLEWTVEAWGLFAGDVAGPQPAQAIEAYVRRMLKDQADFDVLARLAAHAVETGQAAVAMVEASLLAGETAGEEPPLPDEPVDRSEGKTKKVVERTRPLSAGTKAIDSLVEAGLLMRRPGEWITFPQPAVCGYLASRSIEFDRLQDHSAAGMLGWSIQSVCLRYAFGQGKAVERVSQLIAVDTPPLHENLTAVCGFLSDASPQVLWRPDVMRLVVRLLQDDHAPMAVRARLVSTLAGINDPAVAVFFRQLLCSPSADVRRLAALGAGALQDGKAIDELTRRLSDPDLLVQTAACFALAALPVEGAREAVMAVLEEGDEDLRLVAAEALAVSGPEGQRLLLDALASPDLVMRKAAIPGLALIRQPWVNEVLEKTAVEDGQWVIRNAAVQAIESLHGPKAHLPKPVPPPSEAPWLIRFAGRLGESVPRGQSPLPLLLRALAEGSPSEQRAAIQYLRRSTDPRIIDRLCEATGESSPLSDSAVYALWWMHSAGVRQPAANRSH